MRYAVWWVRLIYAAWMIPAGLNHFISLYPQPFGNQPLSIAVFTALLDSGLFTLVKAIELAAGVAVLVGFRLPLLLIAVLPVSFTVWYWDTELQGWWTGSAVYGWAVLGCNLFLCLAYWDSYRPLFARAAAARMTWVRAADPRAIEALRILFGAILGVTALRYFMPFLLEDYVPLYEWRDPLAARLMAVFDSSGLGAVARFVHLAGGLMLLTHRATPFALAAVMPINLCGLYVAVALEGAPAIAALALLLVALNALLCFAYLPAYRPMLAPDQRAEDESDAPGRHFESLFVNPLSGAPPAAYLGGGAALAAALLFYWRVVPFANGTTGLVTLAFPSALFVAGLARALARRGDAASPSA